MHFDAISIGAIIAGLVLLGVALYYKKSRMVVAVVMLLGGVALTMTAAAAFIGVPIVLVALFLFYTEYAERRKARQA